MYLTTELRRLAALFVVCGLLSSVAIGQPMAGPGSHVYWSDYGTSKIQRAKLDGSNIEDLVTGVNGPNGIAVDTLNGKVYWTDVGKIERADLDGANRETVVAGLDVPVGVDVDVPFSWLETKTSLFHSKITTPSNWQESCDSEAVYCELHSYMADHIGN